LSYNEIGDAGAISVARLFEEHEEMQNRLELWNAAKTKRIELSEELMQHSNQVLLDSLTHSCLPCGNHLHSHSSSQLKNIQQQYSSALKSSEKIQQASNLAMLERFRQMESGQTTEPTRSEELSSGLMRLLLDDDSDDHKLLTQVLWSWFC
jgi:hypothetical protein